MRGFKLLILLSILIPLCAGVTGAREIPAVGGCGMAGKQLESSEACGPGCSQI